MSSNEDLDVDSVAGALRVSIGLLLRRLRQVRGEGGLTLPETAVLARLDRNGPSTPGALAKAEEISPQAMAVTVGGLEARGLVARQADPHDGRRAVISITETGLELLRSRRDARTERLAQALSAAFTPEEVRQLKEITPLIERLAQCI
ncbi:MAG TPA: MarR family transcriptional regulator [Streptosporangiaceae bacterium]|nr:MarR family transcriptional regulator [Streptosporangiaceae bacterium]